MKPEKQPLTRSEREWRRRRIEILDAATELFIERGYANTTMQAIAEASEFSVGYLYRHFDGKYGLLQAIAERQIDIYQEIRERVRQEETGSVLGAIRLELQLITDHLLRNPDLLTIFKTGGGCQMELKREITLRFRQEDENIFLQAIAAGEIGPDDPGVLAAALDGMVWGLVTLFHENLEPERYTEIPAIVEQLFFEPLQAAALAEEIPTRKNP